MNWKYYYDTYSIFMRMSENERTIQHFILKHHNQQVKWINIPLSQLKTPEEEIIKNLDNKDFLGKLLFVKELYSNDLVSRVESVKSDILGFYEFKNSEEDFKKAIKKSRENIRPMVEMFKFYT